MSFFKNHNSSIFQIILGRCNKNKNDAIQISFSGVTVITAANQILQDISLIEIFKKNFGQMPLKVWFGRLQFKDILYKKVHKMPIDLAFFLSFSHVCKYLYQGY